jgi:hypothetical protein
MSGTLALNIVFLIMGGREGVMGVNAVAFPGRRAAVVLGG